jgi:hypothetical protein
MEHGCEIPDRISAVIYGRNLSASLYNSWEAFSRTNDDGYYATSYGEKKII